MTLGLTGLAGHLGIGLPPEHSTQIAEIARAGGNPALFTAFQATTMLLLLAAASSSFQAGPGLLKALAGPSANGGEGILPAVLSRTNRYHTPYWGLVLYLGVAAGVLVAAGAEDQALVLFYAVAVFLSFLIGLLAMVYLARGRPAVQALNLLGAVAFTLVMNLARGLPLVSLGVALGVAGALYTRWVRAGRPQGIATAVQHAEADQSAASDSSEEGGSHGS